MFWDDFWLGVFVVLAIAVITAGIVIGVSVTSANHRSAINNCLNHNRAPSECKGL
jgi:hypothetical protein